MSKTLSLLAAAGLMFASSAAFAADITSRTVTVRGGQGDVTTVVVPAKGYREAQPHQLTGSERRAEPKTTSYRTGQGDLVQVTQR